ncbi:hypothetical protein U0070_002668, partial [Myodes glareolus]
MKCMDFKHSESDYLQHLQDTVLEMPVKSSAWMAQCLGHLLLTLPLNHVDWIKKRRVPDGEMNLGHD